MQLNPLTGAPLPHLYEVEISNGKNVVFRTTLRTTNEEEAVAQTVKLLTTKVKKLNG